MTTRATVTSTRTPAPMDFDDIEDIGQHPARGRCYSAF